MEGSQAAPDRQVTTNALIGAGAVLAAIGAAFIGVGATESTGSHQAVWINSWFIAGCVLGAGGIVLVLVTVVPALRGRARIIWKPEQVFNLASSTLNTGKPWDVVRIYAPVGLWDKSDSNVPDAKTNWLNGLAEALGDVKDPGVKGFYGVFGLPRERALYDDYAKKKLEIFEETIHTELRYFPPETESHPMAAPGMGIIVFENKARNRYKLVFAFAGKAPPGEQGIVVRSGFSLRGKEIGRLVAEWFDEKVWTKAEHFVLRGKAPDNVLREVLGFVPQKNKIIDLRSALRHIERTYYSLFMTIRCRYYSSCFTIKLM